MEDNVNKFSFLTTSVTGNYNPRKMVIDCCNLEVLNICECQQDIWPYARKAIEAVSKSFREEIFRNFIIASHRILKNKLGLELDVDSKIKDKLWNYINNRFYFDEHTLDWRFLKKKILILINDLGNDLLYGSLNWFCYLDSSRNGTKKLDNETKRLIIWKNVFYSSIHNIVEIAMPNKDKEFYQDIASLAYRTDPYPDKLMQCLTYLISEWLKNFKCEKSETNIPETDITLRRADCQICRELVPVSHYVPGEEYIPPQPHI